MLRDDLEDVEIWNRAWKPDKIEENIRNGRLGKDQTYLYIFATG